MRRALDDAEQSGVERADSRIGYINAHGTGTQINDAVEAAAIHQTLGEFAPSIPVGATKSLTGHGIGAAGAIEAMATVLALDTGSLPFTAGVGQVDPSLDLDVIVNESRSMGTLKDIAISNSLAFGGLNAVLAFRRFHGTAIP
jgi:3-oxoacyl-[acyl-carrier-protein] synthase II/nodulation protein E